MVVMDRALGIYEAAAHRREYHAAQSDALRRRITGAGPTLEDAWAQAVNPFDRPPRLPTQSDPPYWQLHSESRIKRRLGSLRNDLDVNPTQIVQAVCRACNLTSQSLFGKGSDRRVAWPRQVAAYFVARYSDLSLPQIARIFVKDHTTILYSIRIVPRRIEAGDEWTRRIVHTVEAMLRGERL